jgi:N-sulfoglucosamine sulfohydrolase
MNKYGFGSLLLLTPLAFIHCTRQKDNHPNILFAIGDDISWPHMSAYGCSFIKTPGFDRVARNGILFTNAYTPNAKSAPSRACILTGRNSWQLEAAANHWSFFPPKFETFMESMGHNCYNVGCTAKGWAPGVALDSSGKARQLTGKPFNNRKTTPPTTGISDNDYAANFEDFLNSREPGKPFCFWYGSFEPHRRYEYGTGVSKGGKHLTDVDKVFGFWPDNDTVRNDLLDYAFETEYFDSHLVKMLDMLEKRGELENTIIIVTADNGMPFPRIKGQAYEYSNHMPLAIMWGKGIKDPGRVINDFISFIDFAPTFLELAGIKESESGMQPIEGHSFTDLLFSGKSNSKDNSHDHILIGKERHDVGRPNDEGYPIRGIIKDGFLYINNFKTDRWPAGNPETGYLNTDASPTKTLILNMKRSNRSAFYWNLSFGKRVEEELYNILQDPECMTNLVTNPEYNNVKNNLSSQMVKELTEQGDPRIIGNGDIFDNYPYAEEKNRDFYNHFMKGELTRKDASWVDSTDFEPIGYK